MNLFASSMALKLSTDPLFLGLDLSTQSLKAILLVKDLKVVHQAAVHFDRDLPYYGTTNGAIQGPDKGEVTSPVQMWLEAVDLLFERLHDGGVDFGAVAAVSGAGQVDTYPEDCPKLLLKTSLATWVRILVCHRRDVAFFSEFQ